MGIFKEPLISSGILGKTSIYEDFLGFYRDPKFLRKSKFCWKILDYLGNLRIVRSPGGDKETKPCVENQKMSRKTGKVIEI